MAEPTNGSVGIVTPQTFTSDQPIDLQCGVRLPTFDMVYETYGALNAAKSNAVLVCHALSGNHHAAGHYTDDDRPGWWDACIGPGKPIDTNRWFVVSPNNLGGCHGSSGPLTTNPATGQAYGAKFPKVTVQDWVHSQTMLADHLGITQFAAVLGGSLGGMQAMQWAMDHSDRIGAAVVIASAARLSAQNIAFNEIARQAITTDPGFRDGDYKQQQTNPDHGLGLARMLGHVTYLSDDGMRAKFGRELKSGDLVDIQDVEFQVESYLRYQGQSFAQRFDANTYLLMTYALDYFDPAKDHGDSLATALAQTNCKFFVASFSSDWRFAPSRSREIVNALVAARKDVVYTEIQSEHGHDSFLLPIPRYLSVFAEYMNRLHAQLGNSSSAGSHAA